PHTAELDLRVEIGCDKFGDRRLLRRGVRPSADGGCHLVLGLEGVACRREPLASLPFDLAGLGVDADAGPVAVVVVGDLVDARKLLRGLPHPSVPSFVVAWRAGPMTPRRRASATQRCTVEVGTRFAFAMRAAGRDPVADARLNSDATSR